MQNDSISNWFVNLVSNTKYPTLFILYILATTSLFHMHTFPLAFLLLLFLHLFIPALAFSDFHSLSFSDLFFGHTFYFFHSLFATSTFFCWALLFIAIALVVSVLSRLDFYKEQVNPFTYFNGKYFLYLQLVIGCILFSTILIFILYFFNLFQLLRNNPKISYDWITYTPLRLLSTTILLISFIVYYVLTGYTNNIVLVFGIALSIVFYFYNIINKGFTKRTGKSFDCVNNEIPTFLFCTLNIYASLFLIGMSMVYYVFIETESKLILLPFITWFFVSIYNIVVSVLFTKDRESNHTNMQYISCLLIVILTVLSSLSVYYSYLINKHFEVVTDDSG
jgi:hypothetical protein